ncbi:MAG TPA: helicase-associated domain-containing protein [Spirochaetota bacterium]|nr:helicase-associated domain-containing protein [Spirochaetota bacterium]
MKRISNNAATLSDSNKIKLASILKIQKPRNTKSSDIISHLLTYTGLDAALSECSRDELMVLRLLVTTGRSFTFRDIEKELDLSIPEIEKISDSLSSRLVVYVLKNRQLLNNKLDKVFIYPEVAELFASISGKELKKKLQSLSGSINPGQEAAPKLKFNPRSHAFALLALLAEHGGITTLDELAKKIPLSSVEKVLHELKEKGIISIFHSMEKRFITFILIDKRYITPLLAMYPSPVPAPEGFKHNRYKLLYSLLKTYDVITGYGLFLTQNREFRKIDFSRLSTAMPQLETMSGKTLSRSHLASLCLYILYQMKLLSISRENVSINFKPVEEQLSRPASFLKIVMDAIITPTQKDPLLEPQVEIPDKETVTVIRDRVTKQPGHSIASLFSIYQLEAYSSLMIYDLSDLPSLNETLAREFSHAMNFFLLTGVFALDDNMVVLSDAGMDLYRHSRDIDDVLEAPKTIYINPDFTVMIPSREVSSEIQYHILAHTDIIQDDMIIHARITRQSILKAQQRGMDQDVFLHSLEQYAKNKIPQNLNFQLREWVTKTLRVQIRRAILLHSSDPEFIDEITEGKLKPAIEKRITQHYAIINPDYLDRIIKASHKKEAVISIFEDES